MKKIFILISLCTAILTFAANKNNPKGFIDFEGNTAPANWKAGNSSSLKISNLNSKIGNKCLEWEWNKSEATISFSPSKAYKRLSAKKSALLMWIYNPKALQGKKLEFKIGAIKFPYYLNFKGWRVLRVMYYDNFKKMPKATDHIKITAPRILTGKLYLDWVNPNFSDSWRFYSADKQMPWNRTKKVNHWVAFNHAYDLPMPKEVIVKPSELNDAMRTTMKKLRALYLPAINSKLNFKNKTYVAICKKFKAAQIRFGNGIIRGRPIAFGNMPLPNGIPIKDYLGLMFQTAKAYHSTNNTEIKENLLKMFTLMTRHMLEQGWAENSVGNGSMHHLGYRSRLWPLILVSMEKELKQEGLLRPFLNAMSWYSIMGELKEAKPKSNFDTYNTRLQSILIAILLKPDDADRATWLRLLGLWFDRSLADVIDPCGTAMHHGMIHPGYTFRALCGLAKLNKALSHTDFQLPLKSRKLIKQAVYSHHYFSHPEVPRGISGRCPSVRKFDSKFSALRDMALSGTPDCKKEIDPEMADLYLKLNKHDDSSAELFKKDGYKAANMDGFYPLQGAAVGILRRNDWMVSIDGISKYRRGTEFYGWTFTENAYARYLNLGSIQILSKGSREDNGWNINGWNYNYWPGTTSMVMPAEKLYIYYGAVKSPSPVGGSTDLDKNGAWGMSVNTLGIKANKSVFCFDNRMVCVGTGISLKNKAYPAASTLFQVNLDKATQATKLNGEKVSQLPFNKTFSSTATLTDGYGNAYYFPKQKNALVFKRHKQNMLYFLPKYYKKGERTFKKDIKKISRGKQGPDISELNPDDFNMTSGDYALAYIDHGKNPRNASYSYVVLVQPSDDELAKLANSMKRSSPSVKIVRKDNIAHIVSDKASGMTGYVFFKPENKVKNGGIVKSINRPVFLMIKPGKKKLQISIASSVRDDLKSYKLTITGKWRIDNGTAVASRSGRNTTIKIPYKNNLPVKITLKNKPGN